MKRLNKSVRNDVIKCKVWLVIWSLYISTCAAAGHLTSTVRVVDTKAQPIVGTEVAIYEEFYDYSGGDDYTKLLGEIKKTDANGHCVLNVDFRSEYNVFVVARKSGLAIGWDGLNYGLSDRAITKLDIILESPCTLAGNVVDEKGNSIAGAKVRAVPKTSYLPRLQQRPILAPEEWFTTQTDAKGSFRFDSFAADVSADFWVTAPNWGCIYKYSTHWLDSCGFAAGRTDIRLVLPREVQVRGRVINAESGSPVTGAHVLIHPDNIKEHANPYCPKQTVSGQDGQFNFEGIPPGKHYINVSVPQETMELVDKRVRFDAQANQEVKELTVALDKGGLIEIIAREKESKKPVSNLPVYFWQARQDEHSTFYKNSETSKTDGTLRVWAPPGECKLSARYDRYLLQTLEDEVIVAKGQTAKLEILLDSYPGVSGVVLNESGQPVAGAIIVMVHPFGQEVFTDATGKFEAIFEARSGERCLFARHTGQNLAAVVEFKDESKPVNVTLKPALSITGLVTDANGTGIPAARISVHVGISSGLSDIGAEVLTDTRGRYDISSIPPEQAKFNYRVSVYASGYGPYAYRPIKITGQPGKPVELERLVLQSADQSVSGMVVDAEGKPAARVPVFLHGRGQPRKNTATDENGRFTITRICKGEIRLQANFEDSPGGEGFLKAQGGDQDVKIILGQRLSHTKDISLIGKPLPELKEFKIQLSPADVNDRMILVCFWDMEQRPSRQCITKLAEQAKQLKEKGITVITIQGTKVDEAALNEWIKKYNIPFAVGMVTGDEEKIRFEWGVKSLPWLILANRKHIIITEGSGISELSEKIGEAVDVER